MMAGKLAANRQGGILYGAVESFFSDLKVRRNKSFKDRYQLPGKSIDGLRTKIIFQPRRRA
jgi:hypothetical protein